MLNKLLFRTSRDRHRGIEAPAGVHVIELTDTERKRLASCQYRARTVMDGGSGRGFYEIRPIKVSEDDEDVPCFETVPTRKAVSLLLKGTLPMAETVTVLAEESKVAKHDRAALRKVERKEKDPNGKETVRTYYEKIFSLSCPTPAEDDAATLLDLEQDLLILSWIFHDSDRYLVGNPGEESHSLVRWENAYRPVDSYTYQRQNVGRKNGLFYFYDPGAAFENFWDDYDTLAYDEEILPQLATSRLVAKLEDLETLWQGESGLDFIIAIERKIGSPVCEWFNGFGREITPEILQQELLRRAGELKALTQETLSIS